MKLLIFTEGTILIHQGAKGKTLQEINQQITTNEASVKNYSSYIPIGNAVSKLKKWSEEGWQIFYLTSRTKPKEVNQIKNVLSKHCFPKGKLLSRGLREEYKDVAEKIKPDILIEDDCASIGGVNEMTITYINPNIKKDMKLIIVREFGGIDHLPNNIFI